MNYNEQDIAVALSLLIKKNPIVSVDIQENKLEIKHLVGESVVVDLPERTAVTEQTIIENNHPVDKDLIRSTIHEYIESLPKEQQIDHTEQIDSILEQLSLLQDQIQSVEPTVVEQKEVIEYDDTELKQWVESLVSKIQPKVINETNVVEQITETVDPLLIQQIVAQEIDKFKSQHPERYIIGIENRMGDAIVVYSDGTRQVITDILTPSLTVYKSGGGGGGGGGVSPYTNILPTNESVGGVKPGTIFENVGFKELIEMIFFPVQPPNLTNPSTSLTGTNLGLQEIGAELTVMLTASFSRGSINPQFSSESPFRSGPPTSFLFTGDGLTDIIDPPIPMSSTQSIPLVVEKGNRSWTARNEYEGGVQPKDSNDMDFGSPLPPGTTSPATATLIGVYPYFATTSNITTLTKQPLANFNSTVTVTMVQESGGNKQMIEFPAEDWNAISRLEQWNTTFERWDTINLAAWAISTVVKDINGHDILYRRYTHQGSLVGTRQLRWFT